MIDQPNQQRPEILERISKAWNITLTEPSKSWDMQPPIDERYTEYVLTDAERAQLRTALSAPMMPTTKTPNKATHYSADYGDYRCCFPHCLCPRSPSPVLPADGVNYAAAALALGFIHLPTGKWAHPNDGQHMDMTRFYDSAEDIFNRELPALHIQPAINKTKLYTVLSKSIPADMIDGIWQELNQ